MKVKTKIIEDLYEDAKEQRANITDEAADIIKDKFGGDNETRNAVRQALNKIMNFVEGGGQLDIDIDENDDETSQPEQKVELKALIESIRDEIQLLPDLNSRENEE